MILIAVIWAAWYSFSTLQVPEQPVSENELADFTAVVSEETNALIGNREIATRELELAVGISPGAQAQPSQHDLVAEGSFRRARNTAESALEGEIGSTEFPSITEGFPASELLAGTLDEADRLYGEWLEVRTGQGLGICMESLTDASGRSILSTGYSRLLDTLNRDLIKYRSLESLPIHDEKLNLYQSELDNIISDNADSHSTVADLVSEANDAVDAHYNSLIAELLEQFVQVWTGGGIEESGPGNGSRVLEDIRARLAGFSPVYRTGEITIEPSPAPDFSGMDWLADEISSTDEFRISAGKN